MSFVNTGPCRSIPLPALGPGLALSLWAAENVATRPGTWAYRYQVGGWHPVGAGVLVSWFPLALAIVLRLEWQAGRKGAGLRPG